MCVCVYVLERDYVCKRESEGVFEGVRERERVCVCVGVCVKERERERERERTKYCFHNSFTQPYKHI